MVYHHTTMRKTLGVTIHIVRASKFIRIPANKAFKIKHFPQALKVQYNKPGENNFVLVHSCRRGVVHFPAHTTTLLTFNCRHSNTIQKQHERKQHERQKTKANRQSHYPCHRSNQTRATLQNHKQCSHATKCRQLSTQKIQN